MIARKTIEGDVFVRWMLAAAALATGVAAAAASYATPAVSAESCTMRLALAVNDGIDSVAVDGSGLRRLTRDPSADDPVWSPDGTLLAFDTNRGNADPAGDIVVVRAEGGARRRIGGLGAWPSWFPDSSRVFYSAYSPQGQPSVYSAAVGGGRPIKLPRWFPLTDGSFSPDGSQIAYSDGALYAMNADGTGRRVVTRSAVGRPSWSPDGTQLAFAGASNVFIVNASGGGLRRVTNLRNGGLGDPAVWSPDGNWIAFPRVLPHTGEAVFLVHPDGSGLHRLPHAPYGWSPTWQPCQ